MKYIQLLEEFVGEGINDPGILKAFFMAGGPGSGKSYVAANLFALPDNGEFSTVSYQTGLKLVNSDQAFELLLKKANIDMAELMSLEKDPDKWAEAMKIRDKAKRLTAQSKEMYLAGKLGMIIDGTGKNFGKIESQVKELRELGYDCYMVFVNTSKEVALERNNDRPRKLPEMMVSKMWSEVQENIGSFQRLFKAKRFEIVDNSKYGDTTPIDLVGKEIRKFMAQPVSNPIGKRWMKSQKKGK
jgi:predicted kinase|tara:strand:+ start:2358 stop:3086 length:729 start_codon:yes stop_codon:yes gene_type:complete